MTEQLMVFLEKAYHFEENGYIDEAVQLCGKCIEAFPEYEDDINFEIAKMNCRNGNVDEALVQFLMLYQKTGDDIVSDLILEVYYKSQCEGWREQYEKNCRLLETYAHYFGTKPPQEVQYYPIWVSETKLIYFNLAEKHFCITDRCHIEFQEAADTVLIAEDLLWLEDILQVEKMSRQKTPFMDGENALLLVYQKETFQLLLQLLDLTEIIALDRIILYEDASWLEPSFVEDGVPFPVKGIGNLSNEILSALNRSHGAVNVKYQKYKNDVIKYYEEHDADIVRNIKEKKPRILFITSRFTTVLQYHIRDCKKAAEKMGLNTELLIEKDRLSTGWTNLCIMRKIAEFLPDIIFIIDHFRFEHSFLSGLDNLIWVTWIQDHMPHIIDKETPSKLLKRDFIMNHFTTWNVIKGIGYPASRTMDAPVVANEALYKPYQLSETEKEAYGADICMVCHASDAEECIEELLRTFKDEELRILVRQILEDYCNLVKTEEFILYTKEDMYCFMNEYIKQLFNIQLPKHIISYLAENTYIDLNQRAYREAIANWLIEAGYHNIKLWGNGWLKNPQYQPYAMGGAQNGEVLSKILQSTKIVLGNNFNATGAARAWESMLSGTFYMSNYVPPEVDMVDIRKILKENNDIIIFHNKQDLLSKIDYYLFHDDQREHMAYIGRQASLKNQTFRAFMERMLNFIKNAVENEE